LAVRFNENLDAIRTLLDNGADIEASGDHYGWTPLGNAREMRNTKAARVLMEYGAQQ